MQICITFIFQFIIEKKEVFIYVIEEKIPEYSKELVRKLLVKSLKPDTSWLRIQ